VVEPTDLFCLVGMTPQVVSEALAALAHRGVRVRHLTLYTTQGVGNLGELVVMPRRGESVTAGPRLEELFGRMPAARPAGRMRCITFPGADPRDDEGLRALGQHLDQSVRNAVREAGNAARFVACLSGGRKTMSAWLTISLALHARAGDQLGHVLVPKELERADLWPPRAGHPEDLEVLELGQVPFPRLAPLVPRRGRRSLESVIAEATLRAGEASALTVVESDEVLRVHRGDGVVPLPRQSVVMLALYAECDGEVAWLDLSPEYRTRLERLYEKARSRGARGEGLLRDGVDARDVANAHAKLRSSLDAHAPGVDLNFAPQGPSHAEDRGVYRVIGQGLNRRSRSG